MCIRDSGIALQRMSLAAIIIAMGIMMAASDIRWSALPHAILTMRVAKMEKISPLPISVPFLNPMKNNRMAITCLLYTS